MLTVLREIASEDVYVLFNWDGKAAKSSLKDLNMFQRVLFGMFNKKLYIG